MTILPIWKTIELDMTSQLSSGAVDFSVYTGSSAVAANLIYSGRAYADGDGNCKVRLNDIFKDCLGDADMRPESLSYYSDRNAIRQFHVTYGTSGTASYKIVNDWSYEAVTRTDQSAGFLNDPVTGWLNGECCWVTLTFYGISKFSYRYVGTETIEATDIVPSGDSVTLFFDGEGAGTLTVTLTPAGGGTAITRTYTIGDDCNPMSLTYRNRYGGYDTLRIASMVENKAYSRNTYERDGSNASGDYALRRDFSETVTRTFTLRTPVLTDAQAAKMDNVLGTTQAWLNTLETGTIAVNVNTASWKKKTFKNEGRKRVVYEFEVQFAQPMERR